MIMIDGFIVEISGRELSDKLLKQSQRHAGKAAEHEKRLAVLGDGAFEDDGAQSYIGDPRKKIADRILHHKRETERYRFFAAHVVLDELYRIGGVELARILEG